MDRLIPHDLSEEVLDRFAAGEATPEEREEVLRHIYRTCHVCIAHLRQIVWSTEVNPVTGASGRGFQLAAEAPEGPGRWPPKVLPLLAALDALPAERRGFKARNLPRFASVDLAFALADRAYEARFKDHEAMLADARLAVEVADTAARLRTAPAPAVADARARAWCEVGNALRVRGELAQAERAFATAKKHLEQGSGDPQPRALYCMRLSSLRYFRRQFAEAILLLNEVVAVHRGLGQPDGEAKALMSLAIIHIYAGEPGGARPALRRAIELLMDLHDRSMSRAACHNLVRCYIDLGEPKNAHTLWVKTRTLFDQCDDELSLVRRDWQAGEIDLALGLYGGAEAYLERVREQFIGRGLAYEAAVVSLDLAEVYAHQGKPAQLVRTITETIPIFQALGVTRDLLAALMKIGEVATRTDAVLGLLRQAQAEVKLLGLG